MTKYEIAQKIRALCDVDYDDLIDVIHYLAHEVENDEENYTYKGERENGEWVEGCVLQLEDGECRIATGYMETDDENLFAVRAYEVDPDTIEAVEL